MRARYTLYNVRVALAVYQYPTCSTCRKALAWLGARGVPHDRIDIVLKPPSRELLEKIAKLAAVPVRRLFNTAGESYRAGNFKDRVATMTDAARWPLAKASRSSGSTSPRGPPRSRPLRPARRGRRERARRAADL